MISIHTSIYCVYWWGRGPGQSGACVVISYRLNHTCQNSRQHPEDAGYAYSRQAPLNYIITSHIYVVYNAEKNIFCKDSTNKMKLYTLPWDLILL